MNKMDPCTTQCQDCHSGHLPPGSGFTPGCPRAWVWSLSHELSQRAWGGGWGILGYWCQWLHCGSVSCIEWLIECALMGSQVILFKHLKKYPSLREQFRKIAEFKGDCGTTETVSLWWLQRKSVLCVHVCASVCVHVYWCMHAYTYTCVYVYIYTFGLCYWFRVKNCPEKFTVCTI